MPRQLDWSLTFPIQDGVLPDDALVVKSRGTSGAGQFEIAGSAVAPDGSTIRARDVAGKKMAFVLPARKGGDAILLGESYPIQVVGGKVRVSVQGEDATRPNIGNLFAAAFMLPTVSSRAQSLPFDDVDLGEKTYWIDDVSCHIVAVDDDSIVLQPDQFIFASSNKNDESQPSMMARFDYNARLDALYSACERGASISCGSAKAAFAYYRDYLTGKTPFEFEMASFMKGYVMSWLEKNASGYTHAQDPLPALSEEIPEDKINPILRKEIGEPRNLIYFGAPGTGKSHELGEHADRYFDDDHRCRVTFYPDYTYSQFVGCFKPMTEQVVDADGNKRTAITYRYALGPFLETYVKAIKNPEQNYLLIVEEINRANPAAVFGDVFQLLDRRSDGCSEYTVATPEDMREQLMAEFDNDVVASSKLAIPSNMYIWATMNSADQGVFPMDTAFKRRWDFRYMGIDEGEDADIDGTPLNKIEVPCGGRTVVWNNLRHAINEFMASDDLKINEDKLLGPFFINPSALTPERFADVFKDKVLLYLYEDAGKTKRTKMFKKELNTYAKVCAAFDKDGEGIFGNGFDDHIVFGETDDADDAATEE